MEAQGGRVRVGGCLARLFARLDKATHPRLRFVSRSNTCFTEAAMSDSTLDGLLTRLNTPDINSNPKAIASQLQTMAKREDGATLLREMLHNGQDPLQAVPPATMTLPYLYILSVCLYACAPCDIEFESCVTHVCGSMCFLESI